jgi:hypothetical protein
MLDIQHDTHAAGAHDAPMQYEYCSPAWRMHPQLHGVSVWPLSGPIQIALCASNCFIQVSRLAVGDLVVPLQVGLGSWREAGVFPEEALHAVPGDLPLEVAATISIKCAATASKLTTGTGSRCPAVHAKWDQLYPIRLSDDDLPVPRQRCACWRSSRHWRRAMWSSKTAQTARSGGQ